MARGRARGHKGGRKQYSNPDQIKDDLRKEEEKRKWREAHPDSSSEESEDEAPARGAAGGGRSKGDDDIQFASGSSSSEEESSSDEDTKKKGVEGLIEVENPNRVQQKMKKVSSLKTETAKPALSRREREELDKQKAKAHYQKLHAAGKTDEARADLARLAIIRKQREEAAAKREADQKAKEEAAKAKADAKTAGRR